MSDMSDADLAFHESLRPSWGPDGTLVYAAPPNTKSFGRSSHRARERNGILTTQKGVIVSENRDLRFAKFSNEVCYPNLKLSDGTNLKLGIYRIPHKAKSHNSH